MTGRLPSDNQGVWEVGDSLTNARQAVGGGGAWSQKGGGRVTGVGSTHLTASFSSGAKGFATRATLRATWSHPPPWAEHVAVEGAGRLGRDRAQEVDEGGGGGPPIHVLRGGGWQGIGVPPPMMPAPLAIADIHFLRVCARKCAS